MLHAQVHSSCSFIWIRYLGRGAEYAAVEDKQTLSVQAGLTQQRLRALVRVRHVKVAEYQARGVVHFHAVIRLDAPATTTQPPRPGSPPASSVTPSPKPAAAAAVTVGPDIHPNWPTLTLRFGAQVDIKPIARSDGQPGTGRNLSVQAVGNHIAKYATQGLDAPGLPHQPLRSSQDIAVLRRNRHYRDMITTAWRLGGGKLAPARTRLCKWAHALANDRIVRALEDGSV